MCSSEQAKTRKFICIRRSVSFKINLNLLIKAVKASVFLNSDLVNSLSQPHKSMHCHIAQEWGTKVR